MKAQYSKIKRSIVNCTSILLVFICSNNVFAQDYFENEKAMYISREVKIPIWQTILAYNLIPIGLLLIGCILGIILYRRKRRRQ